MSRNNFQRTHLLASYEFVGKPKIIKTGKSSEVILSINKKMVVDKRGLVHGGFTFSLADYASMIAVNHPNVVLLSSNVRFLKPVVYKDRLIAKAHIIETKKNKNKVSCEVFNQKNERVFEGEFFCISLPRHVLDFK
ncbi:MAG: hotdog domain-containing protein [Promethearchaeota archaeon]